MVTARKPLHMAFQSSSFFWRDVPSPLDPCCQAGQTSISAASTWLVWETNSADDISQVWCRHNPVGPRCCREICSTPATPSFPSEDVANRDADPEKSWSKDTANAAILDNL